RGARNNARKGWACPEHREGPARAGRTLRHSARYVKLLLGGLVDAASRLHRHRQRLDLGHDRKVLDGNGRVAVAGHVENPGALRFRLVSANDPELVALLLRVEREVVEKDDGPAAGGVEED